MFHPFFPAAANFWRFPFLAFNRRHASRRVKINRKSATITMQFHPTVLNYGHGYVLLGVSGVPARLAIPGPIFTSQQFPRQIETAQ
jgi:hypothetical protein